MHLADKVVHAIELLLAGSDHQIDTLAQDIELGICDQDGDLDQDIFREI